MSLWRQFARGLRRLVNPKTADQEIAEEVESYLEQATADLEARGLSCDEARRAARLDLGSAVAVREQIRSSAWENAFALLLSDLRYAARRLRGNPGFTAVSAVTLALGIAASTAIFSVIEGALLKPLPYPQSGQIVALRHTAPGIHIDDLNIAASLYFTHSEENRVFQDVGMWLADTASVRALTSPRTSRFCW
jgi:putative ABC transport system permease protein